VVVIDAYSGQHEREMYAEVPIRPPPPVAVAVAAEVVATAEEAADTEVALVAERATVAAVTDTAVEMCLTRYVFNTGPTGDFQGCVQGLLRSSSLWSDDDDGGDGDDGDDAGDADDHDNQGHGGGGDDDNDGVLNSGSGSSSSSSSSRRIATERASAYRDKEERDRAVAAAVEVAAHSLRPTGTTLSDEEELEGHREEILLALRRYIDEQLKSGTAK